MDLQAERDDWIKSELTYSLEKSKSSTPGANLWVSARDLQGN